MADSASTNTDYLKVAAETDQELFGISELALEFNVSTRAIRFYENKGLLSPRRVNGHRIFTKRDRARLALILRARSIGYSLGEISHYLDLYGHSGSGQQEQLKYLIERTAETIADLENRKAMIEQTLSELKAINAEARRCIKEQRSA
ncbi:MULTISPECIES: MerR family transcriptional regulator [Pseudovibrio]|uniref:MerR family transcriptional regulator n=1 Tax=Stappiaceae TaxID=2821832 RepID=UPI0023650103|nr:MULTISPECIES: MerR family DNA-binding transcriptional regulator [Pseudovibrio]MDD7911032.1 MerR family DNA-binding transcriptional regulator [Pseudovibrio exalbescens]MDX5593245.1 MerR family DNA-binding transcriptional regulator [Pseudovibrio sp. SPO723]